MKRSGELELDREDDFRSLLRGAIAVTGLSDLFASYAEQIRADGTENIEAAHVALPMAAAAEQNADPIFAAIEWHKLAYQRHVASFGEDELEATILLERRKSSFHDAMFGDEDWRVSTDDPAWIAHIEESCSAHEAEIDAAISLVSSKNLTRAGATALLQYASELEAKDSNCWPDELFDDDGKRRSWYFFLMKQVASAFEV
jgi:hypothetical protein